jgi:hypothetical protein
MVCSNRKCKCSTCRCAQTNPSGECKCDSNHSIAKGMAMALFKLSDKDNSGTIDAREWKRMAKMFGVRAGNVPYKPMNFDEFWRRISSYM